MTSLPRRLAVCLVALSLLAAGCAISGATETATPEQAEPTYPEAGAPGTGPDNIRPSDAPPVTPEFPFSGHGETLALVQYAEQGGHRILLLDPYGLGFREFRLPETAEPTQPITAGLSPDGGYYAYYSGSTGNADLELVVYDLNAQDIAIVIPLLSSDYPANFQALADTFISNGNIPEELSWVAPENIANELQYAFEYGIATLAWSPQGRYLAFSGQMEGPSSDLYLLDLETMEFTRLTSGTGMMERIGWSPDGHWIRHTSTYFVGAGYRVTNHVASLDGSQVLSFPTNFGLDWGPWLTANLYLANEADNGPGTFDLKVFDARSGGITTIFNGAFFAYAFDPSSNTILLQSYGFFDDDPAQGLYLIGASEPYHVSEIMTSVLFWVKPLSLDEFPFIGYPEEGGTILIRRDGSFEPISDQSFQSAAAPTANRLALYSTQSSEGLWLYDVDLDQRTDVYSGDVSWVEWRPDSGALFYLTDHELHVYNLETDEHMLIFAWPGSPVANSYFKWVNLP